MITYDDGRATETRLVDFPKLIRKQREQLAISLDCILAHLKERDKGHIDEFEKVKLVEIFHPSIDWMMGHVAVATYDSAKTPIAQGDLKILRKIINRYIVALRKRGPQMDDNIKYSIQPMLHAIDRLEEYFSGGISAPDEKDANIFSDWLRGQFQSLVKEAKDIDDRYESGVA